MDFFSVFSNIALDRNSLCKLGITHVLNAAKGNKFSQVATNQIFYDESNTKFFGLNLMDVEGCKIDRYFIEATSFMHAALDTSKGMFNSYFSIIPYFKF